MPSTRVDGPANRLADVHPIAITRHPIVGGKWKHLLVPATAVLIEEDEIVARHERLLPRRQRRVGIAIQFRVRPLHDVERVVVEAEQHVQTMLLDALVVIGVSTTRALAAQSPTRLVHRDVMACPELRSRCQFERGSDGACATTQHRNASNSCFHPEAPICRYDRLRCTRDLVRPRFVRRQIGNTLQLLQGGSMAFHPYLFFGGNCREAFDRYKEIFGGELFIMTMKRHAVRGAGSRRQVPISSPMPRSRCGDQLSDGLGRSHVRELRTRAGHAGELRGRTTSPRPSVPSATLCRRWHRSPCRSHRRRGRRRSACASTVSAPPG